jgi:alkylation response protein AidB-like acyl-CoA dehydrogenase
VNDTEARALVTRAVDQLVAAHPDPTAAGRVPFLRAQYEAGLAWVHFPPGSGGLGVPASLQSLVTERLAEVGAPTPGSGDYIGMHQAAASIAAFGTPEQAARFLPAIFDGTEHWCQLFSEPGAGSDLAGLATTAARDGDEWIVTGQKIWTSGAHAARWAILLARSDPDAAKHRGLTFFVCDMSLPGIEIRPLRQADGAAHFNEVFLDGVRLPDDLRIADVGQGWAVALTGLHAEREGIGEALHGNWDDVADAWRRRSTDPADPVARVLRDRVADAWIQSRVLELSQLRMRAALGRGGSTPLGSLLKIAQSRANQRAASLLVALAGPAGQVGFHYDAALDPEPDWSPPPQMFVVRSRAHSIEGGSDEIQRNIIGEQVLGLPGDVRVDKGVPWRDVPRS